MASKVKSVTFTNESKTREFRPNWKAKAPNNSNNFLNSGLRKNITHKNTKTGHSTVEANYNAEKGRLNALTKKKWRSMFTPVWMKLYKDITEKNARFLMNTDEADKVESDLYGVLRSTAKGRAKRISNMNVSNAEKEEAAKKSIEEFIERASTLTYDRVLQHVKEEQEKREIALAAKAAKLAATASKAATAATATTSISNISAILKASNAYKAKLAASEAARLSDLQAAAMAASKPTNLNRLSGKKRQGVSLNKLNNKTKKVEH